MELKTFYVRAAAAAAAALLFLYPFPAHAADSAALQGQVSAAQREYESAASTLDSMQQQASDTRQQVNDLQSQTDALRGQLGSIVAQLEQSRTELAEAQNQATAAAKALEEKQAAFSARYDSCKQQLTAMQLLNEGGEISLLMQADDLYELLTFWQVLNDLTEHNKQLLDELDAEAQALDTQRQQAEAAATQAEQAAQALQARQDELTQTQIQLEQALQQASTELDSQQAAAEAQAAVTEEKRKAYEQATAALDAYLKAQSQKYQDPARHCSLDFTCPLPSVGRISTYFGETVVLLSHKKADSYIHIDVEFGEGEGKIPVDSIAKRAEAYKPKEKVTYKMIKEYIEAKYGFKVHTAYIAEVKRNLGLPMYDAPNAVEELKQPRKHPTPEKVEAIKDALRYFAVI